MIPDLSLYVPDLSVHGASLVWCSVRGRCRLHADGLDKRLRTNDDFKRIVRLLWMVDLA